ncbi:response regulator with CheY-like receiver domain and winged-helix DNA-binding domain [Desulfosporosinus orientis DSM 765]|uniref:Stage 0 sporulation protein A homolog n=1 Tax=Desulfosporosinus orientis (strain ATCC 19365 / DSM 765 / NCIMB 8382 / VKM B-1628 / Singapore I) TaxID=768706 RepID=G7WDE8_DESOD|nr:response regulator transcription factor [Desulfosporosinus orientis]AET67917.1 response regulator with CheY-like receiver domain and winged-helix DNA-binding domain [Desulfosporosinus orientis DSM 765]
MDKVNILIVDDDKNICKLINLYLKKAEYETTICHDGSKAIDLIQKTKVDLVLLDLMIPEINGWEVCKLLKIEHNIPVIMVSARDVIKDKIAGFDAGADDYIVKPFDPEELVARVKARLKSRTSEIRNIKEKNVVTIHNLAIDMDQYQVRMDGQEVDLKPKEIQLLHFLAKNKNIVFTREQLLEKLWDYNNAGDTRTVDVHIKCLREKLKNTTGGWKIKTIWGVGYKMEVQ